MSIQLSSSSLSTTNGAPPVDAPPLDSPPLDAPPVDSPPVDAPPVDSPPMDSPPVDSPPVDAPPLDSPPVDAPPLDSPPVDAPPLDSPPVDAPPLDSPPMDPPPLDSPPVDAPPLDSPPVDAPPMDAPPLDPPRLDPAPMDAPPMDERLLRAAISGNAAEMRHLVLHESPDILLGTTPQESTCLHISLIFGHTEFYNAALALNQSLFSSINSFGETPLLVAVKGGHVSLASAMLNRYQELNISEMILKKDNNGDNALHHAIRNGYSDLALKLIAANPDISKRVNKSNESPMYIAVLRRYDDVSEILLEIPISSPVGTGGENALHAAVRSENPG